MRTKQARAWILGLVPAAFLLFGSPAIVDAQDPERALSVLAGPTEYDLSGTGWAPFMAVRLQWPLTPGLLVEPGLTHLSYRAQFDDRIHHVLPEVQLQAQVPGRVLRPYIGAGFGASWELTSGRNFFDPTLSGAAGLRAWVGPRWQLTGELRVRSIDPWTATTADWGLGIGWRF